CVSVCVCVCVCVCPQVSIQSLYARTTGGCVCVCMCVTVLARKTVRVFSFAAMPFLYTPLSISLSPSFSLCCGNSDAAELCTTQLLHLSVHITHTTAHTN